MIKFEDTSLHTWEERDRAMVELRNKKTEKTLVIWWDDDVNQAVEDGFLDPSNLHESAYDYYTDVIVEK